MTIFGFCLGILCIISGVLSLILKRSIIIGHQSKKYTEKSVKLFIRLAGIIRIVIGFAVIFYTIGCMTPYLELTTWFTAGIFWISLAAYITIHFVVLSKKH